MASPIPPLYNIMLPLVKIVNGSDPHILKFHDESSLCNQADGIDHDNIYMYDIN